MSEFGTIKGSALKRLAKQAHALGGDSAFVLEILEDGTYQSILRDVAFTVFARFSAVPTTKPTQFGKLAIQAGDLIQSAKAFSDNDDVAMGMEKTSLTLKAGRRRHKIKLTDPAYVTEGKMPNLSLPVHTTVSASELLSAVSEQSGVSGRVWMRFNNGSLQVDTYVDSGGHEATEIELGIEGEGEGESQSVIDCANAKAVLESHKGELVMLRSESNFPILMEFESGDIAMLAPIQVVD